MTRRAGALAAALLTGCLVAACQQALAPSPAVDTVDVLDFLSATPLSGRASARTI